MNLDVLNELDKNITPNIKYAIFDIDGTISRTTILTLYTYMKEKKFNNKLLYDIWLIYFLITHVPVYLIIDAISREYFQKLFFSKLKEFSYEELNNYALECFNERVMHLFKKKLLN